MAHRSGQQLQVLQLYRSLLRLVRKRNLGADTRMVVQREFRQRITSINYQDVSVVEYFLRLGQRRLESLERDRIQGMTSWSSK